VSLRARLTIGTVCTLALAICVGFLAAYFVVRGQLRGEVDSALSDRAALFVRLAHRTPTPTVPRLPGNLRIAPPRLGGAAGYVQFVNADGNVRLPAGETIQLPTGDVSAVASGREAPFYRDATVDGTHLRIYTTRLDKQTAVEIARPLAEVDHSLDRIRLLFVLVSFAALAVAAAVGMAVSQTILRPVKRLTGDAERIAETGDLRERTDQTRSDELGRLAVAFNTMLDALSRSVTAQRQLVADASHELRTPLASARTNLEVVELHEALPADERRRIIADALAELREMTHLIEELVELARGDVDKLPKQRIRLDHVTEEVLAGATRRTPTRFLTELHPTVVDAAPAAITRAISNLLDNAVKWSPADGEPIEVTVTDGTVTVRDHGPGIDPADLPHIFDRFYRATEARRLPGSGLGLAIVRQVAETHGGTVTAGPADGGGSIFTFSLPAAAGGSEPETS
jgi:two-component system sensor histidine kinase MprB